MSFSGELIIGETSYPAATLQRFGAVHRPKDESDHNLQRSKGSWGQGLRMHKTLKPTSHWLFHDSTGFTFLSLVMGHCVSTRTLLKGLSKTAEYEEEQCQ